MRHLTWLLALCLTACPQKPEPAPPAGEKTCPEPAPCPPPPPLPPTVEYDPSATQIVMLGTGTPISDPDRSGPAVAILSGGQAYLVDAGPGIVRRATAAFKNGFEPLDVELLNRSFITHLHSDHTAGYPDLILTPWVLGRDTPLEVYGPPGLKRMTAKILDAFSEDIEVRLKGNQPSNDPGIEINAHEFKPGVIYEEAGVKVTAFAVDHGAWKHAYGFRFDTPDRSIVVSGDTVPVDSVVEACDGCDVLIHEVYSQKGFDSREQEWQAYHKISHTSGPDLGNIAARAKPRLLVLTHQLLWGATPDDLLAEVRAAFDGEVVYANDLDVF